MNKKMKLLSVLGLVTAILFLFSPDGVGPILIHQW